MCLQLYTVAKDGAVGVWECSMTSSDMRTHIREWGRLKQKTRRRRRREREERNLDEEEDGVAVSEEEEGEGEREEKEEGEGEREEEGEGEGEREEQEDGEAEEEEEDEKSEEKDEVSEMEEEHLGRTHRNRESSPEEGILWCYLLSQMSVLISRCAGPVARSRNICGWSLIHKLVNTSHYCDLA